MLQIDQVTGRTTTFEQVLIGSMKVAGRLQKMYGVGKGSIVAISSENRVEYPIVTCAIIYLNATLVLLNPAYTPTELGHVLELTKPKVAFASTKSLKSLQSFSSHIGTVVTFEDHVADFLNNNESQDQLVPSPVILKHDVAVMVLSSGTTGLPKAVQLTHHNVMTVLAIIREDPRYTDLSVPIKSLGLLPFFHVYGFMLTLNTCCNGFPMVVLPRFEPALFLQAIHTYKITMLNLVPALVVFLAKHPLVSQYDLSSLKMILCGAAPLSKDIADQVLERLPHVQSVRTAYGMSESTLGALSNSFATTKPGSVGRAQKTAWIKVVEIDNVSINLGPNQVGEICVKGPLVMKGYYKNPEATKQAIDPTGWLHTGDTGYYDGDGFFFVVDRIKDLIKYKGFQVAPAEIEAVLLSHSAIADAAVVGIPDEASGEVPAAFVVLQPGQALTAEQVGNFVAAKLSSAKHLRGGVLFVDEIPKTGSGKILRRELRQRIGSTKAKL